jgi:hypothetical protein
MRFIARSLDSTKGTPRKSSFFFAGWLLTMRKVITLVLMWVLLAACGAPDWGTHAPIVAIPTTSVGAVQTDSPEGPSDRTENPITTEFPLPTEPPSLGETLVPSPTVDTRLRTEDWQNWPVVPTVSQEMKTLFQHGLALGNNPAAFSKIGDGEISTVWFLTQYDLGPSEFHLGDHSELLPVIEQFSGSFERVGLAAGRGYSTTIILGRVMAGTKDCTPGETHLDCELRVFHPSFAVISLGTNQVWQPEVFEPELRKIIERLLEAEVVPILSTKADNLEGNHRINTIIVRLAYEYDLPLWNFWRVVQPLPAHGLQADHEHLTYAYSDFSNELNFQCAWPWRNLTALQVLDSVYRGVTGQP